MINKYVNYLWSFVDILSTHHTNLWYSYTSVDILLRMMDKDTKGSSSLHCSLTYIISRKTDTDLVQRLTIKSHYRFLRKVSYMLSFTLVISYTSRWNITQIFDTITTLLTFYSVKGIRTRKGAVHPTVSRQTS